MTTDETLKHIRSGMRLISHAMCDTQMLHNAGFTNGQISMSYFSSIISHEDYKSLQKEVVEAKQVYKSNKGVL